MDKNNSQINVIKKTLDILLLFRHRTDDITVDEISQQLDIPRSTVYRYVRTLTESGFLEKYGKGYYRLGLALVELSRTALNSNRDLRLLVFESMTRLAETIKESVTLMRLYERKAVCIENIEGQYALRVTMERGRTQPLHAGASSKLLLAHLPEEEWEHMVDFPLVRYTDDTITDFNILCEELYRIREQGYAVSNGEIDIGARAVAVPLRNRYSEVIAALSIEAPITRLDDAILARYIDLLKQEVKIIHEKNVIT